MRWTESDDPVYVPTWRRTFLLRPRALRKNSNGLYEMGWLCWAEKRFTSTGLGTGYMEYKLPGAPDNEAVKAWTERGESTGS